MKDNPEKFCLLVCRNFRREVDAVLEAEGLEEVSVCDYPPICGQPHAALGVLRGIAQRCGEECDEVLFAGGCFMHVRQELSQLLPECRVHCPDQCFYLMADRVIVDRAIESGAYVLTPGWLEQWRKQLGRWGFDKSTARLFFSESAKRLVMLDTKVYPGSAENLSEFSEYVDRPFEIVPVGLEHLRLELNLVLLRWQLKRARREHEALTRKARRASADQAMALDLLAGLSHAHSEEEAIAQVLNLYTMMFAPGQAIYVSVTDARVNGVHSYPPATIDPVDCQSWVEDVRQEYAWLAGGNGFRLRIACQEELLGLLEIRDVALPEHGAEYLNVAIPMARLCGLAVSNARLFHEVEILAETDPLTGLFNRRQFFSLAQTEFARARRYGRCLAILMVDVDHFKRVNDVYGHPVGDQVLVEIARCCVRETRSADVRGRYGGEEFVILMPEADKAGAVHVAERLRRGIMELCVVARDETLKITASLGIAILDDATPNLEALLGQSDQALYLAKESGRNRVCVFNGSDLSPR